MHIIEFILIFTVAARLGVSEPLNLALNKQTYQSSTAEEDNLVGTASKAVDGNTASDWLTGSCTMTNKEKRAWWMVDLGAVIAVSSVVITNRKDCCSERLGNVFIRISQSFDPKEGTIDKTKFKKIGMIREPLAAGETREVKTKTRHTGRYLLLQLKKNDVLSLCEVKVYGDSGNCAFMRPAFQSSNLTNGPEPGYGVQFGLADKAVDGLDETRFRKNSCSHTKREDGPWWLVDLGGRSRVFDVTIVNRGDCCWERLHDFSIKIGDYFSPEVVHNGYYYRYDFKDYHEIASVKGEMERGEIRTIKTKRSEKGRYLVVQLRQRGMLALCEVKVNAVPA